MVRTPAAAGIPPPPPRRSAFPKAADPAHRDRSSVPTPPTAQPACGPSSAARPAAVARCETIGQLAACTLSPAHTLSLRPTGAPREAIARLEGALSIKNESALSRSMQPHAVAFRIPKTSIGSHASRNRRPRYQHRPARLRNPRQHLVHLPVDIQINRGPRSRLLERPSDQRPRHSQRCLPETRTSRPPDRRNRPSSAWCPESSGKKPARGRDPQSESQTR